MFEHVHTGLAEVLLWRSLARKLLQYIQCGLMEQEKCKQTADSCLSQSVIMTLVTLMCDIRSIDLS